MNHAINLQPDRPKTITLSGKFLTIPSQARRSSLAEAVAVLLAVPEVRKAAANWAVDELLAVRELLQEERNDE